MPRIYKGSEITLKLPVHVCGLTDLDIEKVILYTTNPENAIEFKNIAFDGSNIHVRVEPNSFDIMEDGVINYIAEGEKIHIERQSDYYVKSPQGYIPTSFELQNKVIEITDNSTTVIKPDEEYFGLEEVEVKVAVPLQDIKRVEVNSNGIVDIEPDSEYKAMEKVQVTFDYIPVEKPKIPNGLIFFNSTWETFDMGEYDWSDVYSFSCLFDTCVKLKRIDNFPSDIVPYCTTKNMFNNDAQLEEAPYFEMKYIGNTENMFYGTKITTIPQYDMVNVRVVNSMFHACRNLTTLPLLNWESVVTTENCFADCVALTTVGGFQNLRAKLNFQYSPLTDESVSNIINYVYNFTANAETPDSTEGILILKLDVFNSISDELKALATSRGWSITA